jgi:outer membrane protein assembly factor BamA
MTSLTGTKRPNEIPFYMMSTLGGQQTLRGFSDARFRDQNFLLLNSEYRWEAFSQMDAVVFADAGKVFPLTNQIGLDNLESSYGLGLHFKTTRGPLFYVEFGFSNENQRIFLGFRPAF